MDTSLKQRLVGAAVLVALAVIFLPMLIGGPGSDTTASRVSTEIPDRDDRQFVRKELPLTPPAPVVPETRQDDPDRVTTLDMTGEAPRRDALSGDVVGAAASEAVRSGTVTSAPAPVVVPAATSKAPVATKPEVTPVAPAAPAPAAAPATPATGSWAVNLGSYANAANATALVAQLRQRGLAVYSENVTLDGKAVQRVRLGPYAQRSEAESARLSLRRIRTDLPTSVVSLEGEAAPAVAKPAVAGGFAVQLGALSSQSDAEALRERARKAGFPAYVERVQISTGTLWRVRVGPELQRANAEQLRTRLKAELGLDGNVVPHP